MDASDKHDGRRLTAARPPRPQALALACLLSVLLLAASGCPKPRPSHSQAGSRPEKTREDAVPAASSSASRHSFLIVLIDETGSFVASGSWDQSIGVITQAINYMRGRDQICAIGIDHRSGDMDDVRLPVTALPAGALPAVTVKKQIADKIAALKPRMTSSGYIGENGKVRGTPKGSDVEGAIDYAALLATRNAGDMKVRVLAFSDFDDDVASSAGGATTGANVFPDGAAFQAFFVVNPEKKARGDWERRIGAWAQWMSSRGLSATAADFQMPAESLKPNTIRDFMRR
ncbi:MAG: hypothetical protein KKI08_19575 [Armatimonadetes bacterium]|nr:hypothetical protein [Armatimonadota bacterium]